MTRFTLTFLAATSLAGAASASYELLLQLDYGGTGVHRYDPNSGAYLGAFGAGDYSFGCSLAVLPTKGRCYIMDLNGRLFSYDYSTGNYVNTLLLSSINKATQIAPTLDGNLLWANGNTLRKLNPDNGATLATFTMPGGFLPDNVWQNADGFVYAVDRFNGRMARFGANGGSATALFGSDADITTGNARNMATRGSLGVLANGTKRTVTMMNLGSSITKSETLNFTALFTSELLGVSFSHGAKVYLSGYSVSEGRIYSYDTVSGTTKLVASRANSTFSGSAIVLAPEPGTLAVIGVGLLALKRRRK